MKNSIIMQLHKKEKEKIQVNKKHEVNPTKQDSWNGHKNLRKEN
jgi:hypothetical protein